MYRRAAWHLMGNEACAVRSLTQVEPIEPRTKRVVPARHALDSRSKSIAGHVHFSTSKFSHAAQTICRIRQRAGGRGGRAVDLSALRQRLTSGRLPAAFLAIAVIPKGKLARRSGSLRPFPLLSRASRVRETHQWPRRSDGLIFARLVRFTHPTCRSRFIRRRREMGPLPSCVRRTSENCGFSA